MPNLETGRLLLRQWRADDFEPLAAFLADDEVNRYRGGGVDRNGAWRLLCEKAGQWTLRGYGSFAVAVKQSEALVGWVGLWHPADFPEPELAWSLFPAAQGKGYASEAAERALRWAAEDLALPALFSFVHPDNHPSRRVAERLGARVEKQTEFRGQPRLVYRHRDLKSETQEPSTSQDIRREIACQS